MLLVPGLITGSLLSYVYIAPPTKIQKQEIIVPADVLHRSMQVAIIVQKATPTYVKMYS